MAKGFALLVISVLAAASLLACGAQAQYTMQVKLRINNTGNTVYVPGVGETPAGTLGYASYADPLHYYLASYSNSYLTGLVSAAGNSITVSNTQDYHTLEIDSEAGSDTFLVLSGGDWNRIESQIVPIEAGKFLKYVSPSFGFGLGTYNPVTVMLKYTNIDIRGDLDQSKGLLRITIENRGVSGSRPVVEVRKS
jgi:hypothetical protein